MAGLSWFQGISYLIEYYTTIGNGTILEEEYTTIQKFTLLKDIDNLMYHAQLNFSEDNQPNPMYVEYTNIVVKTFYTTIGHYPTLHNFLAITPKDISHWEYYQAYPNKCAKPNIC